jgi:hypothetical protein
MESTINIFAFAMQAFVGPGYQSFGCTDDE